MATVQTREARELTFSEVLQRLGQLGVKPSSVRALGLPDWWDPALETDPMAVLEGAGYIAKRLGLDPLSVLTPGADIVLKGQLAPKFKTRISTNLEEIRVIQGIACRVAEALALCTPFPYQGLPSNAQEIRQRLLSNKPWVDLESLIGFCWGNDVILKLSAYTLFWQCLKAWGIADAQLRVLPTAAAVFDRNQKIKDQYSDRTCQQALQIAQKSQKLSSLNNSC